MEEHRKIHPAYIPAQTIHKATPAVRVLVSPPTATTVPIITVYFRDSEAVRAAYGCLLPHLSDITQASIHLDAPQPNVRYPLASLASTKEHLALLSEMGISRIALPFIADTIIRSQQAHDSLAMGQLIIRSLEAPEQSH